LYQEEQSTALLDMASIWEYHKGRLCIFNYSICQEGFCARCILFQRYHSRLIQDPRLQGHRRSQTRRPKTIKPETTGSD
jgi:hypothetical protein